MAEATGLALARVASVLLGIVLPMLVAALLGAGGDRQDRWRADRQAGPPV